MFQIYTMVSEIHVNADLVLGVKKCGEFEAEISMSELKLKLLNRTFLVFPVHKEIIKPKERRYVKVEAPSLDEISGLGIITLLGLNKYDTLTIKVKFKRNKAF